MSRRSPRIRVRFAATVEIAGIDHTLVCHTRDISAEGCFLDTSEAIEPGVQLSVALMDNEIGEVVDAEGMVARCIRDDKGVLGIGVRFEEPPVGWTVMVERYQASNEASADYQPPVRLRILVVGDDARRRGALALYVTSGWDVRFATNVDSVREALYGITLNAVIAEHDLSDQRWAEVLATARRIQPDARRIVRTSLKGGQLPTDGGKDDLVHRVVDLDAGLEALVDALTADYGESSPAPE